MKPRTYFHRRHQYRAALCGHKAVEAGAVCLLLMVGGDLGAVTFAHLGIAAKTGMLAVSPALAITFTQFAHRLRNRWTISVLLGGCTFVADVLIHGSHYPGAYTEATLTGFGTMVLSIAISYTRLGTHIDGLADGFLGAREQAAVP